MRKDEEQNESKIIGTKDKRIVVPEISVTEIEQIVDVSVADYKYTEYVFVLCVQCIKMFWTKKAHKITLIL